MSKEKVRITYFEKKSKLSIMIRFKDYIRHLNWAIAKENEDSSVSDANHDHHETILVFSSV